MLRNKPGFFLIEIVLYLLLLSLVLIVMLRMSMYSITQINQTRGKLLQTTTIHALLQKFSRDIEMAPAPLEQWHVMKHDALIWNIPEASIGWMLEKDTLIRYQGTYNVKKGTWGKKTKSIAAKNLKNVSFEINKNEEHINAVTITIETNLANQNNISRKVLLHNGKAV